VQCKQASLFAQINRKRAASERERERERHRRRKESATISLLVAHKWKWKEKFLANEFIPLYESERREHRLIRERESAKVAFHVQFVSFV
jgi:hypothetical protein